jgi:predicted AAA+ superfamily ATPase
MDYRLLNLNELKTILTSKQTIIKYISIMLKSLFLHLIEQQTKTRSVGI